MTDIETKLKNDKLALSETEKSLSDTETKLETLFTTTNYKAESYIHHTKIYFQITFHLPLRKLNSTTSSSFTISLIDEKIDVVSHVSFMNNNSNSRNKLKELKEFNNVSNEAINQIYSVCTDSEDLVISILKNIKTFKTTIINLNKSIDTITTELEDEKHKNELNQIFSVLKPIGEFDLDSFLCSKLLKNFDSNKKPTKDNLEQVKLIYTKTEEKRIMRTDFPEFTFIYLTNEKGNIKFEDSRLRISVENNKFKFNFNYKNNVTKKSINKLLSNQIEFQGSLVTDYRILESLGIKRHYSSSIKELRVTLSQLIIKKNINNF
jgi:hypothetical protein